MNADEQLCTYLEWDSDFFGCRIARANISRLNVSIWQNVSAWCAANRIDCLYFLADCDDAETTHLAESRDFLLADVRMTFERPVSDITPRESGAVVRPAREEDLSALRAMAREGHGATRFYFDQHFDRSKCDLLYETWVDKSFRGFAQMMLVADVGGRPVAYITGHLDQTQARIGIVGVDGGHRRFGLGSLLVQQFLCWAAREGAARATVVTQGRNIGAQKLYQRNGFLTASCQLWYHRWFSY